jgi:hypothetical protein
MSRARVRSLKWRRSRLELTAARRRHLSAQSACSEGDQSGRDIRQVEAGGGEISRAGY